ncbi:MAG: hypothetical protein E7456_03960 [Ruminococcaceae bacterium]|nr:hypothetical protein [Oscillospiraceae bacterium]
MKSKTSSFNKTIFFNNLTRFWPIWALYLVIWIFIMPVLLSNELRWGGTTAVYLDYSILELANIGGLLCAVGFSVLAAAAVYSYMFSARSANFFSSLPIRREGLFITSYLSGICWFLAANVIILLLTMIVEATFGVLSMTGLLQWFCIVSLQMIIFYSIATACAAVAGNIFGFAILYAALNCVPILLEVIIKYIGTILLRGVTYNDEFFTRFVTPVYMLWDRIETHHNAAGELSSVSYNGWTPLLIFAAVSIVLAVIGLFIYRKRHMETASDFIAAKKLRPVFKYCATVCLSLGLGLLFFEILFMDASFDSAYIPLTLCMLAGGFIGYFASSMMLAKSFRVFKKWKGFAVFSLILILVMVFVSLDVFNIEGYVPQVENVDNVAISYDYEEDNTFTNLEDIQDVIDIHAYLTEDKSRTVNRNTWSDWNGSVRLTYTLKNGHQVERDYLVFIEDESDPLYSMLDELLNDGETIVKRKVGDMPISPKNIYHANIHGYDYKTEESYNFELTPEEAYEFYLTCLLPDMQDGNLGAHDIGRFTVEYIGECYVSIDLLYLDEQGDEYYDSLYFTVPVEAERTVEKLRELDIPVLKYYEDVTDALTKIGGADEPTAIIVEKEYRSF